MASGPKQLQRVSEILVGATLIKNGRCPEQETELVACWRCEYGHATLCHHPYKCAEREAPCKTAQERWKRDHETMDHAKADFY